MSDSASSINSSTINSRKQRSSARFKSFVLPALASVFFLVFLFLKFSPLEILSSYQTAGFVPGLQLFFASSVFCCLGFAIAVMVTGFYPSLIWALLIGQCCASFWVYLRSGLNLVLSNAGLSLPITFFDLALFVSVFGAWCWIKCKSRQQNPAGAKIKAKANGTRFLVDAIVLLVICLIIGQRELPRPSMMSSDPDLHVFWAAQLQRLGTIPASLGEWGPEGLRYPAGFSVMNFLWSAFSFLDLQQVVSAQSLLQSQLALLLLVNFATVCLGQQRLGAVQILILNVFLVASFYCLMPYGYQKNFFHLEGTARTSCLFLLAGMCCSFGASVFSKSGVIYPLFFLSALIAILLIGINPINALYAAPCLALVLLWGGAQIIRQKKWSLVLALLTTLLLPFCDPYFLSSSDSSSSIAVDSNSLLETLKKGALTSLANPQQSLSAGYNSYFNIDFYSPAITQQMVLCLLILYLATGFKTESRLKMRFLLILVPVIVLICISFVIIPGLGPLSNSAQYRLMFPYSLHLSQQLIYLWILFLLCLVSAQLLSRVKAPAFLVLSLPALLFFQGIRDSSGQLRMEARYTLQSGMGFPTSNDLIVVKKIVELKKEIASKYPGLSAEQMPKILVPNFLSDIGWEQWLFPYGGTRILPLYDVFPLAFYYSQGWKDFSFQNYKEKVCKRFDLQWLKERNVRYMFIPDQRGPICVRGLEKILKGEIVFQSGNAVFVKLF